MSEEIRAADALLTANAELRARAEQAEALARTLQGQRDAAEARVAALRQAALAYVTSATYEDRARLRAALYALAAKGGE